MFHYNLKERRMASTDNANDESVDIFNNAYVSLPSTSDFSSVNSTNFTSVEGIQPTDNDDSDFRRLVENDSFLKNASKNDSSSISRGRLPSLIIAAGTTEGSTSNNLIESLQSTIIDGVLDSDASFYSPNATLMNPTNDLLNQRLSSEEEFVDCNSSPEVQTECSFSSSSTKYKSLNFAFSSNRRCLRSENNNTIFKETDKSANSQPSENYDSGIGSIASSNVASKFPDLPRHLAYLTTILEESTVISNCNSKRISGVQIEPLIEDLRKSAMPNLPQTEKFKETFTTLAQILDKSSREITFDQLAQVILYTLKTDYNYSSEHLSGTENFFNFLEISKVSEIDLNNTGAELNSIMRQLRRNCRLDNNIENESSPEWPSSPKSKMSTTSKNTCNQTSIIQGLSRSWGRKEYFPMPPFCSVESNKENYNMKEDSRTQTGSASPKKNKVRFSPQVSPQFFSFKPQKKKYAMTPRFKPNQEKSNSEAFSTTTGSENSFIQMERNIVQEERKSQRNLRSLSMSDIASEESSTSEKSESRKCNENQNFLQNIPRIFVNNIPEKTKKYRKRRSKSLENVHHPVQTNLDFNNDSSRSNINRPSTTGIQRRRFANYQKNKTSSQKCSVRIGDISSGKMTTLSKIQQRKGKNSANCKTLSNNSQSRRSFGVDSTNIPAVSQLRKVFSPASRGKGPQENIVVPRIEITKSSPERTMDQSPSSIKKLHSRKIFRSKSQEKDLQKKPWKP